MIKLVHPAAGALAMAMIAGFWLSTAVSELFAGPATVTTVKTLIPYGFVVLIPALAATGLTGRGLAKRFRGPIVAAKQKRMAVIAANGILVLVPSALFLSYKAQAGAFDTAFYAVQAVELVAGAVNLSLLALNMRDGLRLSRRRAG